MRFTIAATVAGLAAVAVADSPMGYGGQMAPPANTTAAPVYTTEVVTQLTTYCPEATQITHGGQTYTVTEVRDGDGRLERSHLTSCAGYHSDDHQLPMHCDQASLHVSSNLLLDMVHIACVERPLYKVLTLS